MGIHTVSHTLFLRPSMPSKHGRWLAGFGLGEAEEDAGVSKIALDVRRACPRQRASPVGRRRTRSRNLLGVTLP